MLAMAKVLWKTVLTISMEKVPGSVVVAVHEIVTVPPVVAPVREFSVKPET